MPVTRCVCLQVSFEDLLARARELGIEDVGELQEHVEFGTSCRSCLPYVEEVLATGRTSLGVRRRGGASSDK